MVVSPDDFRTDDQGIYEQVGDMGLIGWSMATRVFQELLPTVDEVRVLAGAPGSGKTTWLEQHGVAGVLYFDSTGSARKSRRELCRMAADAGREISCVFLDVELAVCLARNATRPEHRRVPEEVLRGIHHRLAECPPDVDEGWHRVLRVGADPRALGGLCGRVLDSPGDDP